MKHQTKGRAYMRARYRRLREAGTCVICGNEPARPERTCCVTCAKRASATSAKRVQRLRPLHLKLNVCIVCHTRNVVTGLKYCGVCAEKHVEAQLRLRDKRRAEGRCPRCGKGVTPGYGSCEACRERSRLAFRRPVAA